MSGPDVGFGFIRTVRTVFDSQNAVKRRVAWATAGLLTLFFLVTLIGGPYGLINMVRLKRERVVLETEIRKLKQERRLLEGEIVRLKTDKGAVERIARGEYGMAKPGEKIFRFVAPDTIPLPGK